MLNSEDIVRIYDNVLYKEEESISPSRIKIAIKNMAKAYNPDNTDFERLRSDNIANYNDPAHRCAYLHKYAPLHTCLVQDMFHMALQNSSVLRKNIFSKKGRFNICSLGGGPGSDIIGILSACQPFWLLPCSAQVVDLMSGWKRIFKSIVEELRFGSYGNISWNLDEEYFDWSYIATDLLPEISSEALESISSADLISMVKFISAATCIDTEDMIETIFNNMKPGAVVLFIDNAAGGFGQMISRAAQECGLVPIIKPLNHFQYTKPEFGVTRYGYPSCYETKVTVQVLMKSAHWRQQDYNQSFHPNFKRNFSKPVPQHGSRQDLDSSFDFALVIFILFLCVIYLLNK